MRRSTVTLSLAILVATAAACGSSGSSSSSPSPQDAVCADANTLKQSVNELIDDVKNGNFGNAKDQVTEVRSDVQALESSVKELASSKQSSVQADVDAVTSTLGGLSSASSLSAIQETLATARTQISDGVASITNTLSC